MILCEKVAKSYGSLSVLSGVSLSAEPGGRVLVTGRSGAGKTTLLRILLGLEKPDAGSVNLLPAAAVFQEDRLFEGFDAVRNVKACVREPEERIREALLSLLPEDALSKPVSGLSGGMRRRVSVVRACLAEGELLVMDEPFTGLDAATREKTLSFILSRQRGRVLILSAHDTEGLSSFSEYRL